MTRGARGRHLKRIFAELGTPPPSQEHVYETAQIARRSRYRVGRDSQGNPAILIETTGTAGAATLTDFVGRHLRIGHGVTCSISESGVDIGREQFSVVVCVDSDDLLRDRFFDTSETLLRSLGETPVVEELRRLIDGMIELFRLATQPPKRTIQGLWGELWTIAQASEPDVLLDAWHAEPTDAFDFNSGPDRLEIKSSGHRTRKHTFSHRQLQAPAGTRVAIASVFVESSGGGPTVSRLVERIRRRVTKASALERLDNVVANSLGIEWRASAQAGFDSELASDSLRFYAAENVPSLSSEVPSGVSDIRYTSDLSTAQSLVPKEMLEIGGLFRAVSSVVI